jgi:GNAT superfamily N-acetyltransferase
VIERAQGGGAADALGALACWHYVGGRPRAVACVLVARCAGLDGPAGVLVVTHATLNGRWREVAWPGWLAGLGPRARAGAINAQLRRIARVIVDPRARGLGVGTELVRAYLREPLTPRTETLAAMAHWSGLFARAGMRAVDTGPDPGQARVIRALAARGLSAVDLCDPQVRARAAGDEAVGRAWRAWAGSSRATRPRVRGGGGEPVIALIERTWRALACRPLALVHEVGTGA